MSENITNNPSVPSQVVAEVKFPQWVNNLGIIPTSYKDSMSYYETLAWLCKYLEETVLPTVNQNGNAVEELQGLYVELNNYVSQYFDNLDVQEEINNKLDKMVEDGTLTNLIGEYINLQIIPLINAQNQNIDSFETNMSNNIATINNKVNSLNTGAPAGVYATVSALEIADPSHDKIYVVTADGKWYYYNSGDSSWTAGGTYQSSGIGDGSITTQSLNNDLYLQYMADSNLINIDKKYKFFDSSKYGYGIYGNDSTPQNRIALKTANFFSISDTPKLKIVPSGDYQIGLFITVNKSYSTAADNLIHDTGWITTETTIDFSDNRYENAVYYGIRIRKNDNSTIDMEVFDDFEFNFYVINSYDYETIDITNLNDLLNVDTQDLSYVENIVLTNPTTKNFKSNILNINHPVLVAHRGYSAIAPENTLPAFEEAGKAGFWGCETDVQETSDGEFVLIHDLTTTWSTGVNLTVANSTYAQLQELTITNGNNINLYSGLKIPKLEDYLAICKKFGMVPVLDSLQFQNDDSYDNFIALLDKFDLTDKCICTGINAIGTFRKIRLKSNKPVCLANVTGDWTPSESYFVGVMNELKNAGIGIEYHYLSDEQVEILRECNSVVMAWTVDNLDEALTLVDKGADIIVTNSLTSLFKEYKLS